MADVKDFDKPLDTWIEEDVDVHTFEPEVDEDNNRVKFKSVTKKIKQRTFYSEGSTSTVVCTDHRYFPLDKGKYLFKCRHCSWRRIAPPVSFKYDPETGILTRRHTGERV